MIFTWAEAALALLRIVQSIMNYVSSVQNIKAGTDAEIARTSVAILQKTNTGKQILAEVMAMSEDQVDATLKGLEPK